MARWTTLLALMAALVVAPPAVAQLPWPADDVDSRARSEGRGLDQASNPAYQRAKQPGDDSARPIDPFRRDWSGKRGERREVRFPNRYGATLAGHLYRPNLPWTDPLTGKQFKSSLPAVVLLPGLGSPDTDYTSLAQQLAEHGYVVLSVEPQGQGLSEPDPNPRYAYCGSDGQWREPQEAGLTETGDCAGHDPPFNLEEVVAPELRPFVDPARETPAYEHLVIAAALISLRTDPAGFYDRVASLYRTFRARFTFTGIDAADWLVSAANPWRSSVDSERIGIAGHSVGADAAIVAGNAHRHKRFRAAVAWDTYGTPPQAMNPTIPTMIQQAELASFLFPWGIAPPDPEFWHSYRTLDRFDSAGVPAYLLALRGSTHQEWPWTPDALAQPLGNASSKGHQVALYFTVAWFDRWLKGHGSPAVADDARQRLIGLTFDDTADRSSIGQGTYDPLTDANVPYRIGGEPVGEHLSRLFRTKFAFDGLRCPDRRAGCT